MAEEVQDAERRYDETEMSRLLELGIEPVKCEIEGKHGYLVRSIPFVMSKRYHILDVLGMGAYGMVVSAMDKVSGEAVAVKKVGNLFDNVGDAKRILREIRLMRFLQHDQVRL